MSALRPVGPPDIARLETGTRALRAVDYLRGGEPCLGDLRILVRESTRLLGARNTEETRRRLYVVLADLRNLAGWVCFDAGMPVSAQAHFSHALTLAALARHDGLVANICYRLGRLFLHQDDLDEALTRFELGQLAAMRSGDEIAASILSVNSAWVWAKKGSADSASDLLARGREQFAAGDHANAPDWARFFTENDLSAMAGAVHTDLALTVGGRHARTAIPLLTTAIEGYDDGMARSRTLSLVLLSTSHLVEGDLGNGVDTGLRALSSAGAVGSARVRDRIRRLASHARTRAGAWELAERIDADTAASTGRAS
ncbi:hypothetical protein ABZX92_35200 [Lentzea sp. NPDC006480]|uniref:hypothetical protein n=1 Tax=Lentzea sp. NPDC006480 TaxID=3157176 RepID=UPI0033A5C6FD